MELLLWDQPNELSASSDQIIILFGWRTPAESYGFVNLSRKTRHLIVRGNINVSRNLANVPPKKKKKINNDAHSLSIVR